jgi:hypothetical protein
VKPHASHRRLQWLAPGSHQRVRTDRVDAYGSLTLRVNGRLHHASIGPNPRPHAY